MADEANVFTKSWDFTFEGASSAPVGKRAGAELLDATLHRADGAPVPPDTPGA
jgi:hypothetical protein